MFDFVRPGPALTPTALRALGLLVVWGAALTSAHAQSETRPAAEPVSSAPACKAPASVVPVAVVPVKGPTVPLAVKIRTSAPASSAELFAWMRAAGVESVKDVADYTLTIVKTESPQDAAKRHRVAGMLAEVPRLALHALQANELPPEDLDMAQEIGFAVLARVGQDMGAITLAMQLTLPVSTSPELRPRAAVYLTETLGAILERKPSLIAPLGNQIPTSSPLLHAHLIAGIGNAARCESTRVLTQHLGRWPELDVMILQQLGRHAGPAPVTLQVTEFGTVTRYLNASNISLRREAALALGRTETSASIPELLTRLSDESPAVRDAAHWALKSITGVKFKNDAARWTAWYAAEEEWWNQRGADLVKSLYCQPPERMASIARELATHRGWREQISMDLVPLLDLAPGPIPRARILEVVTSLRAARAVPLLVERLASAPDSLRGEIVSALERITGETLGPSPEAWNAWMP